MRIGVDPGHGMGSRRRGVFDPGAVARAGGETFAEADIALRFGLTLKQLLVDRRMAFFMTRTSSADDAPLRERARRAAEAGCTHLISLHLNSAEAANASGLEVLFRDDTKDRPLASRLQEKLVRVTGFRDRGIQKRTDLAILRFRPGPAVLIELGFITNTRDRTHLIQRDNRIALCQGIIEVLTGNA